MEFKVGDYVEFIGYSCYITYAQEWAKKNGIKPYLIKCLIATREWRAPKYHEHGTIMFIAPIHDNCNECRTGAYFLTDNGEGFLVDTVDIKAVKNE